MFYATNDADGLKIASNATIFAFQTREEAEAWLRKPFGSEWDQASIKIGHGHFGDCWIKTLKEPEADEKWLAPFRLDECIVQRPGSHPGGRMYWITPATDVLIVTEAREIDEDGQ